MKSFKKRDYPLSEIRRHLEPGPNCACQLSMETKNQYHDHGLAHDDGIHARSIRMLYLGWKS